MIIFRWWNYSAVFILAFWGILKIMNIVYVHRGKHLYVCFFKALPNLSQVTTILMAMWKWEANFYERKSKEAFQVLIRAFVI